MDERDSAELKNEILRLISDREHGSHLDWIHSKLKRPELDRSYLKTILEQIDDWEINVAILTRGQSYHIIKTPLTQKFLDNGGFVNQYESDREADMEALQLKIQENNIRDLQQENLSLSNRLAEMKLKTHLLPLIISGISAAVAVGGLWYSISSSSDTATKKDIETIRGKIREIEKEKDSLKERLWKAEL